MNPEYKIGTGFDVHRLVEERALVLGGVEIPSTLGALGHSDGDAVCHALIDALLGALGAADIGTHFPDTDEAYKDISSLKLLHRVGEQVRSNGYDLVNADITVLLEMPKIAPWRDAMRAALAEALAVGAERINVKATTTEGLGYTGRREGVAAQAVVLLASARAAAGGAS